MGKASRTQTPSAGPAGGSAVAGGGGGMNRSGKPSRGGGGGGMLSQVLGSDAAQGMLGRFKDGAGGGQMFAGGSPGWAQGGGQGGGQGFVAGGPDPSGRGQPPPGTAWGQMGPGGMGRGRTSGKGNRQTVPGNAGGGMIGRGGMRGRGPRERLQRPPVNPRAKRQQANRALVRGGRAGGTTASRQQRNQPTAKMKQGGLIR